MSKAKDISEIISDADLTGTLDVTGETTLQTHLNMGDGDIIKLGNGADLQIQHSGSYSSIVDSGTGSLLIGGNNVSITNAAHNENMIIAVENGAVTLYHDNATKLETTSYGTYTTGQMRTNTGVGFGSAASNLLEDYEEGTWTPAFSSTNASFAYASRGGTYTKVGRLVMLSFLILLSGAPGGTTSNGVVVSGLPFNSATLVGTYHGGNIGHYFNINLSQTGVMVYQTASGGATVELKVVGDNLGETGVLASHLNSNAQIRGQIIYHTA
tara:strand:- start:26 stop:832 length:807 start_codon:yes stop_codon:yes gene_type:complete